MTTTRIHDTKAPLACCDRCRTAEIGRRQKLRPVIRYTQTAASGRVEVVACGRHVATLEKWGSGWEFRTDADLPGLASVSGGTWAHYSRREALDEVARLVTAAWKNGTLA